VLSLVRTWARQVALPGAGPGHAFLTEMVERSFTPVRAVVVAAVDGDLLYCLAGKVWAILACVSEDGVDKRSAFVALLRGGDGLAPKGP
jgi:hypothetical protein